MFFNYKTFDLISCLFVFRLFHWIFHSIEYRIFITSDSNVWKYLSFRLKATIFLQIFFYLLITAENMDLWIINIHFASHFQWFRRNHRTKLSNNCIIEEHKKFTWMVLMFVLAQLFIGVWKSFAICDVYWAIFYRLAVIKYTQHNKQLWRTTYGKPLNNGYQIYNRTVFLFLSTYI